MARPKLITLTGSGSGTTNSNPYILNWREADPVTALGFDTDGSTTGFTVQYTLANSLSEAVADWVWFNHATMATMTAKTAGSLTVPATAIRLQANATGTDTGRLWVHQSGG